MDEHVFQRRYRMEKQLFWRLLEILKDKIPDSSNSKKGALPNGPITARARLSMALRFCAGGNQLDIADLHGVSSNEVIYSLWDLVDAIHSLPELTISFPETHAD